MLFSYWSKRKLESHNQLLRYARIKQLDRSVRLQWILERRSEHKCLSEDLYLILSDIHTTDLQVKANDTFPETFGEQTTHSCTVFFVFPAGGLDTFHITLKRIG